MVEVQIDWRALVALERKSTKSIWLLCQGACAASVRIQPARFRETVPGMAERQQAKKPRDDLFDFRDVIKEVTIFWMPPFKT